MLLQLLIAAALADEAALERAFADLAERGLFAGELTVARSGAVVHRSAHGPDVPVDPVFRIGSITKSFTAAAVASLADEGRLTLDDPAAQHLPELADRLPGVTIRHLLHHVSGLSELPIPPWSREPTFDELAPLLDQHLRPEAEPGAGFAYSNTGYVLLGEIVRRASGGSYEGYLRETFFEPLGMRDTGLRPAEERLARGHLYTPLGLVDSRAALPRLLANDHRWEIGSDGALCSTGPDLVRWADALRSGRILSETSRAALLTPMLEDYGGGWVIQDERVWHNGALSPLGVYAYLRWSKVDDEVLVLLATVDLSSLDRELRQVAEAALAGEPAPEVSGRTGLLGGAAMLSAWRVHQGLATLALAAALAGVAASKTRWTVLGAALAGGGLAAGLLGFTGLLPAALAAVLPLPIALLRARALPTGSRRGALATLAGLAMLTAGLGLAIALAWLAATLADPWEMLAATAS